MLSNYTREIASVPLTLETGKLAQQANGAVLVKYGDCVVLATATMSKPREGIDFFPLTVEFEERLYARGRIPGSFFRREGRPSTHGTLAARLADRPIRPLFPEGFRNEIQVVIMPLSLDMETPLETLGIIGASAALSISDIPFEGPIGATRMGYVDGELVVNPTYEQLERSALDLIVAGSRNGVVMMEAGAVEMPNDVVRRAIEKAQEVNLEVIALQDEMAQAVGKPKSDYEARTSPTEMNERVASALDGRLASAFETSTGKADLNEKLAALESEVLEGTAEEYEAGDVSAAFESEVEKEFRSRVLSAGQRPDGRRLDEIRPISCEVSVLPRTHGTGLFTRGETQILGVATLGSVGDAQKIDTLSPEETKRFMLHYNFPPYSVGEVRRMGGPGRREIGHGALAERAIAPVLPAEDVFPYTIRLVCEALSSNGSTSMGSVCAGSLALMDAGVPIKAAVAGISIGLVTGDDGRYVTLTDIQGMEDHIGEMDFKVAGTANGITAIQLDIKAKSISFDVVRDALAQAQEARIFLLSKMHEAISAPREEMSPYAPRMTTIKIPVEKIGAVIGPGGKTIRSIVEETGATVDVQDDGTVIVGSSDGAAAAEAIKRIEDLTREVKVGDIYTGKVVRLMNFGAFVEILPGKDGLVHISELSDHHIPTVQDAVDIGDEVTVVVKEIDDLGRINLSRRALLVGEGEGEDGGAGAYPAGARLGSNDGGRPGGDRGGYRNRGQRPGGRGGRAGGPGARSGGPGRRSPR